MKNNPFLQWGCVVLIGAGVTACSVASTDPNQDQDEAIIWQLIAERDSLRTVIDELEDENLYLYEELETITAELGDSRCLLECYRKAIGPLGNCDCGVK